MVVASMYPASRIVVKPINCEYTNILVDNMLLLRTLRYDFCKCSVILEHRYVYTKRILNSTIIANIKVCSIQMQCVIEALMCIFKTYWLNYNLLLNSSTALNICLFWTKVSVISPQSRTLRLGWQISDTEFNRSKVCVLMTYTYEMMSIF